ncbi:MAG: thioredoxin [Polyangiaceae bacterium]
MNHHRCKNCGAFNRVPPSGGKTPVCGRCKQRLDTTGAPQEVNGEELARALDASPVPVLVDFWAPWCGPCRMAAPILDTIARSNAGRISVLKLNTDANQNAAARHGVQGIPLFVMFRGGREAARQTGLLPQPAFERWVAQVST